jgi:hypothetical protein
MVRVVTRMGDGFSAKVDSDSYNYFQLVARDSTQLESDVIRAFAPAYAGRDRPDLQELAKGEVLFHAHCIVAWGIRKGL